MGIQINGSTDRITAIDGTIDFVSNIGNIGLITASNYVLQDAITIGAGSTIIKTVNGKLGIGTDNPTRALNIAKQDNELSGTGNNFGIYIYPKSNGYCYLDALNNSSNNTSWAIRTYNNGVYNTVMQSISGNETTFSTANTERLRITSAGKVGIGTNDPKQSLSITGRVSIDAKNDYYGVWADGDTQGENHISVGRWYNTGGGLKSGYSQYGVNNLILENNHPTAAHTLIIQPNGQKVAIGTHISDGLVHIGQHSAGSVSADAGGDELVLESSGNTGLSILSPGTGESTIFFGNPGTDGQKDGYIRYYHEAHSTTANRRSLVFITGGGDSERLRIDASGQATHTYDISSDGDAGLILNTDDGTKAPSILFRANSENRARLDVKRRSGDGGIVTLQVSRADNSNNLVNVFTSQCATSGDTTPDLTLGGNLVLASGHCIDFSANPDGSRSISTDGNKFDEYEEGTFTPQLNGMGTVSYDLRAGRYTKIGNVVYFQIRINLASRTGGSHAHITNMPFTQSTATIVNPHATFFEIQGVDLGGDRHPVAQFQSSEIYLYSVGYESSANYSAMDENQIKNSSQWGVFGFYFTAT